MNVNDMLGGADEKPMAGGAPKGKGISMPKPEGLEVPEGLPPGETFEVMASVKMGPAGMLVIDALDGVPVSDKAEEAAEEPEDMEEEYDSMEEESGEDKAPGFLMAIEKGMKPKK
jgi:hypothetical protein